MGMAIGVGIGAAFGGGPPNSFTLTPATQAIDGGNWTCPKSGTWLVEVWGPGGGGGYSSGGGGGGGGYCRVLASGITALFSGPPYQYDCGVAGAGAKSTGAGHDGTTANFNAIYTATGGKGGANLGAGEPGGLYGTGSGGDVSRNGGKGGDGGFGGGGGGGSPTPSADGVTGGTGSVGPAAAGGTGQAAGGAGGIYTPAPFYGPGADGAAPGAGGGGGGGDGGGGGGGGNGGAGRIVLTFISP